MRVELLPFLFITFGPWTVSERVLSKLPLQQWAITGLPIHSYSINTSCNEAIGTVSPAPSIGAQRMDLSSISVLCRTLVQTK